MEARRSIQKHAMYDQTLHKGIAGTLMRSGFHHYHGDERLPGRVMRKISKPMAMRRNATGNSRNRNRRFCRLLTLNIASPDTFDSNLGAVA